MQAPIVLFAYRRPFHLRQTLAALLANPESSKSDLIVYSDAAKTPQHQASVMEVRSILRRIKGFRSLTIVEREENHGLSKSILQGVTQVCESHGQAVVIEDDIVTSPYFLRYMNDALSYYRDEERVASIHGYLPNVSAQLPDTFFLRGADCWGWATWQNRWATFEQDGSVLLERLNKEGDIRAFDMDNQYLYSEMLKDQIVGLNDSWAVRWHASCFVNNLLTLYPGASLVKNVGNDGLSGTHSKKTSMFDTELSQHAVNVGNTEIQESTVSRDAIVSFFHERKGYPDFLPYRMLRILRRRAFLLGILRK